MTNSVIKPAIPDNKFDLTSFGGIGNGQYDNTSAFTKAIEACAAAGGGTVYIPKGVWLTGSIKLKSRLRLHLEKGAFIQFTDHYHQYPLIESTYEGRQTVRCQSPLDGEGLEHVAITGEGIIDGAGQAWRQVKRDKLTARQWNNLVKEGGVVDANDRIWYPTEAAMNGMEILARLERDDSASLSDYEQIREFLRPNLLSLRKSKYILLDGPTFQNSPAWCLHPWLCEHVTIQNVQVRNPWYAQNGDGLDVESSRYVLIENCGFDVGDDAICMKSGKDEEGRRLGKPTEKVWVRNCTVYHGHGGFVVGSEMSGGVRDVTVEDCTFIGTDVGIRFKSTRGRGGVVERIDIKNIHMLRIAKEAILFDLYYMLSREQRLQKDVPVTEETPLFTSISIQNVVCRGASTAVRVNGLPEQPVTQFILDSAIFETNEGIICNNGERLKFSNIDIHNKVGPSIALYQCKEAEARHLNLACTSNEAMEISGDESETIRWEHIKSGEKDAVVKIAEEVATDRVGPFVQKEGELKDGTKAIR